MLDVLIVTAVRDEYDAVLKVDANAAPGPWIVETGPLGFDVAFRSFVGSDGATITVAATRTLEMGGVATAGTASALVKHFAPRCLAMSGVCAGRRGKVQLGDVIIADRLWTYDTGVTIVETNAETGVTTSVFNADPFQYALPRLWRQRVQSFAIDPAAPWLVDRPRTYEEQEDWLLLQTASGNDPRHHREREVRCRDYVNVLERLWKNKYVVENSLQLGDAGKQRVERLRSLHGAEAPPREPFRVRVGPIGTGTALVKDEGIFGRLGHGMRNVLGLEMEAAAIGAIADLFDIEHVIVMKGVMDFADPQKNDNFKAFAARASAECLLSFLGSHLPSLAPNRAFSTPLPRPPIAPSVGDDFDTGRRETLLAFVALAIGATELRFHRTSANDDPLPDKLPAEDQVRRGLEEVAQVSAKSRGLLEALFLGTQEQLFFLPAHSNPHYSPDPERMRKDPREFFTKTTLKAALSLAGATRRPSQKMLLLDELIPARAEGNLVTFGSPTSNRVARTAMRYGEIGDGKAGSEYFPTDAMDFKILFELNGERIRSSGTEYRTLKREVAGAVHEIPNWGVRTPSRSPACPAILGDRLVEDYLVISSLPIFSLRSLDAGHRIVNFGGTHREGTDAVSALVQDEAFLEKLAAAVAGLRRGRESDPFWQALILVDCNGTPSPKSILEMHEVEVNDRRLRELVNANFRLLQGK